MLELAICDDDPSVTEQIRQFIASFEVHDEVQFHVHTFSDGAALLQAHKKFDFIFLDVEMKLVNGIETAERIRRKNRVVPIVYVTSYADFQNQAFKVHAFDFIIKPFDINDIFRVLRDFLASSQDHQDDRVIPLVTKQGIVIQKISEIYYFFILEKRTVQISTIYKEYIVKENLSDIFAKLAPNQFYMTHKSCIANLQYVETIEKGNGIVMQNGAWLPLSQRKQKDFLYCLSKQLRERNTWK